MVPDGHQRGDLEVFSRPPGDAAAGAHGAAAHQPGGGHGHGLGPGGRLLRRRGGRARVLGRADPHPGAPEGLLQQPGVVQLRHRGKAPVLGLLHPVGGRHHGVDPGLVPEGRRDLQGRLRLGRQPVAHPLGQGTARRRRHGLGSGFLHAGGGRLRGSHQVRRQDPARGQDGDPRRRPSGRRGVHQLQGGGGEEGLDPHRGRVRRQPRRTGLRQRVLPERQQLGTGDRRIHAAGAGRRRMEHALRHHRRGVGDLPRPGHPAG